MKKFLTATHSGKRIKIFLCGKRILSIKTQTEVLTNVFQKNNSKKVLVSYIKKPFLKNTEKSHTNFLECQTACQIFDELGYNVDIVEFTDEIEIEKLPQYEIVYGFGKSLEKAFLFPQITKIYYGTGCSPWYQNTQTLKRLNEFYLEKGISADKSVRVSDINGAYLSNNTIALGNQFVADTYKIDGIEKNIHHLPAFYYDVYNIDLDKKDFKKSKHNFIWFGSTGCLHKGLDIVIDIFKERKDINLIICGANPSEKAFFKHYEDVFNGSYSNIKYYRFVNIESEEFKNLMNECGSVIFPTASEGGSPAVLMVMANGGLIPIVSRSAGLDIPNFGIQFDKISKSSVEKSINTYLSFSAEELKNRAEITKKTIRENYTFEKYKSNLKSIIGETLQIGK